MLVRKFALLHVMHYKLTQWDRDKITAILPMKLFKSHYSDVIMSGIASQITSLTIVYSTVYSGVGQRKHQSSAPLALVITGEFPAHKGLVTRKMFSFSDVIMDFLYENSFVLTHIPLSPRVQMAISQHRFMALNRRQAIIFTNDTLVYWRIYSSFDIDKLIYDRCRQRISLPQMCVTDCSIDMFAVDIPMWCFSAVLMQ